MSGLPLNLESQLVAAMPASNSPHSANARRRCWRTITCAVREGDADSFQVFYDHFFNEVYRQVARTTGRDESTCLDIVQETMMKIIRVLKPIDNLPQLTAWVRIVTRTTTYDWLKRDVRHGKNQALTATDEPSSEPDHSAIEDQARLVWLEQQLKSLPTNTRNMISLRYRMGWTLKQIAAQFGTKTGTIDGRIRRALEQLKQQADQEFNDDP